MDHNAIYYSILCSPPSRLGILILLYIELKSMYIPLIYRNNSNYSQCNLKSNQFNFHNIQRTETESKLRKTVQFGGLMTDECCAWCEKCIQSSCFLPVIVWLAISLVRTHNVHDNDVCTLVSGVENWRTKMHKIAFIDALGWMNTSLSVRKANERKQLPPLPTTTRNQIDSCGNRR